MTAPVDVARLRGLMERATPGPLVQVIWPNPRRPGRGDEHRPVRIERADSDGDGGVFKTYRSFQSARDADLAVELWNAAPALLSELDRLRKVEAAARSLTIEVQRRIDTYPEQFDGHWDSLSHTVSALAGAAT